MDDNTARCRRGDYEPSQYEIAARCAEIRAGWDEATELKRRAVGKRIEQAFYEYTVSELGYVIMALEHDENPWT